MTDVATDVALAASGAGPGVGTPAETRVVRVTLFEDRAEVVRVGTAPVPTRAAWVPFAGATPFVDERSLQARVVEGPARVVAARVVRRVHHEQAAGAAEREALDAAVRAARRAMDEATCAAARAHARVEHAQALVARWAAGLSRAPLDLKSSAASWRAAYDEAVRAEAEALAAAAEGRAAQARAAEALRRAEVRAAESRATHLRHDALLEARLERTGAPGDSTAQVTVEFAYRTPGACWRPEHLIRARHGPEGRATLEITTWGAVWQRTGERWDDVAVQLSTARPAQAATPPLLTEDVLVLRRKTEEERQRTVIEARDQQIVQASVEGGRRVVEEMPGVDDGGQPLVWAARSRVQLPSQPGPTRVELARATVDARLDVVAYPERAGVAHVRARGTLANAGPLLAGPVHVVLDGAAGGRSHTRFVGTGEPFEIGLGTEEDVRVVRTTEQDDAVTPIVGTQKRKRTVHVWLTNLSDQSKLVRVVERVPVSEIGGIDVDFHGDGWSFDEKDGFATRGVELAPRATQDLTFAFEVRASPKLVLPPL